VINGVEHIYQCTQLKNINLRDSATELIKQVDIIEVSSSVPAAKLCHILAHVDIKKMVPLNHSLHQGKFFS